MEALTRIYLGHRERTVGVMKGRLIYIATAGAMILWFMAADYGLTLAGY